MLSTQVGEERPRKCSHLVLDTTFGELSVIKELSLFAAAFALRFGRRETKTNCPKVRFQRNSHTHAGSIYAVVREIIR